ncbi:MAG TPA: YbaN family protein [Fimbriimonadaceae bacterium]|nr:YbaN family protein [Fimbriimonadaceae bacterium]
MGIRFADDEMRAKFGIGAWLSSVSRVTFAGLGLLFVVMGGIGVVVPGWPATFFFILALWAFKRSNKRMETWLLTNRVTGPTLTDWDRNGSIKKRTKIVAITLLWVCMGSTLWLVSSTTVRVILPTIGAVVTVYILTRPTAPADSAKRGPRL